MSLFNPEIAEKMKNNSSDYLSGADFEGEGLVLQAVSAEPVASKYGVEEDNYFVQNDILKVGETFQYTFKDQDGNEKKFTSHSRPFSIALEQAEIEAGDWVHITRTGKLRDTRFTAVKVEQPVSHAKTETGIDYPEGLSPDEIPF